MSELSVVFPGQGSQSVGMLSGLAEAFPQVRETFTEASDALGFDLWQLTQDGPKEDLNQTTNTQPAMLAAGVAVWRVWQAEGGAAPAQMAGHSLGEYTALVCAGALEFNDAITLVRQRAQLMQEAVPQGSGGMAAVIGLDDEKVRSLCAEAARDEVLEAVNFNAPGQVVVAGNKAAVDRLTEDAKSAGARMVMPLPVSVPSHCALMKPAAEQMAEHLARTSFNAPNVPVLHNASVEATDDPGQIRALLAMQLYSPVRWVETVQAMGRSSVGSVVEAGPGKVLAGLNKRIDKTMTALPVFDPKSLGKALEETGNA